MPTIRTDFGNLYYNRSGTGPAMVFLHGCGRSSKFFQYELKHYETFCEVIAFDLPGHGESAEIALPNERYWELSAEIIATALKELGIDRCFVIGIRDGAIIGLMLSTLMGERLTGLFCDSFEGNEISPERALDIIRHRKKIKRFFLFKLFQQFTMGSDWEKTLVDDNNRLLWFSRNRKQFFKHPINPFCPVVFTCSTMDEEIHDITQKMNAMKQFVPNAKTIFFEGGRHPSFLSNHHDYRNIIKNFVATVYEE